MRSDPSSVNDIISKQDNQPLIAYLFGFQNTVPQEEMANIVSFFTNNKHVISSQSLHDSRLAEKKDGHTTTDKATGGSDPNECYTLFIGDLTPDIDEDDLRKAYEPYGAIHSTFIKREKTGKSKGFGFVNYLSEEGQEKALHDAMNIVIRGVRVTTHMSHSRSSLTISGFPRSMSKEDVKLEIEALTGLKVTVKMKDGLCYATFARKDDTEIARGILSTATVRGNQLMMLDGSSRKSGPEVGSSFDVIYVRNLADGVDERALEDHFNKAGKILRVSLKRDISGRSLGYAFIDYEDAAAAERAMNTLNNTDLQGKLLHIEYAKPKGGGPMDDRRGRAGPVGGSGRRGGPMGRPDRPPRGGGRGRGPPMYGGYQDYDLDYYGAAAMGYPGYYGYDPSGAAPYPMPPYGHPGMVGYAMPYGYAPGPGGAPAGGADQGDSQAWRGGADQMGGAQGGYDYSAYGYPAPPPAGSGGGYGGSGGGGGGYGKSRRGGRSTFRPY
eukprot:TRINITY_DN18515_c0_g1_i1.p1 TRINITY_DN18515_c0_g1~~TRINITY_DN18515_c0_g1_i1.p1  ORF type:complete len:549 (-),score=113.34 TRINITY_DN18515_c0_g1_i1:40-1527(-)